MAIARSNPEPRLRDDRDRRRRAVERPADRRGQLWRSDDGGGNWRVVSYDRNAMGRAHYYSRMAVAPDNENEAYFLTALVQPSRSTAAQTLGRSSRRSQAPGGDHHDIWIDPTNANRHDRGARPGALDLASTAAAPGYRSALPIAQMYHVTVDNQIPYYVYGNKQDGPSYRGPSNSRR